MDESPHSLARLRLLARTDSDGREKPVLSLHDLLFARVLAPPLVWLALKLGFSANAVTAFSVFFGVAGAAGLSCPCLFWPLIGAGLLQFSYLLDCADGDVARARGTSSVDGYLRDTLRHYLMNPLMFAALTYSSVVRHDEIMFLIVGVLAVFFSTRIVNDLADRVTLEALVRRLKRGPSANPPPTSTVPTTESRLDWIRSWFLPDFAVMNWITTAAVLDFFGIHLTHGWRCMDAVLVGLGTMQILLKCGGLLLLWIRGVEARVETLAREIEQSGKGDSRG